MQSINQTIERLVTKNLNKIGIFTVFVASLYTAYQWRIEDRNETINNEKKLLKDCERENERKDSMIHGMYERLITITSK